MPITTSMATSFKQELFSAGHCFNATVTPTCTAANAATAVTAVSSMVGVAVGMRVTGASTAANSVVAAITGTNSFTIFPAVTATVAAAPLTIAGDAFNMALIKQGMAGTYGPTSTNYANIVASSDEVVGTGYTTFGAGLVNTTATSVGTVAFVTFANPSWTTATFSTAGCMIYNASVNMTAAFPRNGATAATVSAGRCCSVHDFGGSQQVSSGTFTVLMPTADSNNAILRIA